MVIFLNDDAGCLAWLARRPRDAVVEGMRDRTPRRLLLHTAECSRLNGALRRGAATTGNRRTVCVPEPAELVAWCREEYGVEPIVCKNCSRPEAAADEREEAPPDESAAVAADQRRQLTRLCRDLLGYVLDVAIIHLEPDVRPYHLTLGDVAQCLRKSPRQLAGALGRLVEQGMLAVGDPRGRGPDRDETRPVHPTAAALRTLDYYAARDRRSVNADLKRLHAADPEPAEFSSNGGRPREAVAARRRNADGKPLRSASRMKPR